MSIKDDRHPLASLIQEHHEPPAAALGCVVPGSVPIFAFGNTTTSKVATVGINPGPSEFNDQRVTGFFWTWGAPQQPPASRRDGGWADRVARHYESYFAAGEWGRDTFWGATASLLPRDFGYTAGTACHVDLSPWATSPVWSEIDSDARAALRTDAQATLPKVLGGPLSHVGVLICRGTTATKETLRALHGRSREPAWTRSEGGHKTLLQYVKYAGRTIAVVGCNKFYGLDDAARQWVRQATEKALTSSTAEGVR